MILQTSMGPIRHNDMVIELSFLDPTLGTLQQRHKVRIDGGALDALPTLDDENKHIFRTISDMLARASLRP